MFMTMSLSLQATEFGFGDRREFEDLRDDACWFGRDLYRFAKGVSSAALGS